jgi:hypothetical protein
LAVAIFVQLQQRSARIGNFICIEDAIVVRIEGEQNQRRWWAMMPRRMVLSLVGLFLGEYYSPCEYGETK